ncbi:MAG: hypothetical protein ABGW74_00350 [Campylobacterales bacterium]
MLKILAFIALIYTFVYADISLKPYLLDIKKQPPITYKILVDKYFYYLDDISDDEALSEIDGEFITRYDANQTAIDLSNVENVEFIVENKDYALAIYDDGYDKYAISFDSKGVTKRVILLKHSFGNIYFNITRDYDISISDNITFYIYETRYDRGERDKPAYLSYKNIYVLIIYPDGNITKRKFTLDELLEIKKKKVVEF